MKQKEEKKREKERLKEEKRSKSKPKEEKTSKAPSKPSAKLTKAQKEIIKNKAELASDPNWKRSRGRPKGSKNRSKAVKPAEPPKPLKSSETKEIKNKPNKESKEIIHIHNNVYIHVYIDPPSTAITATEISNGSKKKEMVKKSVESMSITKFFNKK